MSRRESISLSMFAVSSLTYYIADQICAKIYAAEIVSQRDLRREVRRHDLHKEIR
jgi:hypothetical protein